MVENSETGKERVRVLINTLLETVETGLDATATVIDDLVTRRFDCADAG